jgi:hypothetical protein
MVLWKGKSGKATEEFLGEGGRNINSVGVFWTIGYSGFKSRQGLVIFLFDRVQTGPTQPPIQWVPRALSLGVKRPGREADKLPPSNAEVKECLELYPHSPISIHGVVLS